MIKCFLYLNGRETKSGYVSLPAIPTVGSFIKVSNSLEQQTYKVLSVQFLDNEGYVNLQVEKSPNFSQFIN